MSVPPVERDMQHGSGVHINIHDSKSDDDEETDHEMDTDDNEDKPHDILVKIGFHHFLSQKRIPKMKMKMMMVVVMMMMMVMMMMVMILKRILSIQKILGIIMRMKIMHVKSVRKNNF